MTATHGAGLALPAALLVLLLSSPDAGARERSWGLGWDSGFPDSGIALRRYVSPSWGLSMRLNPNTVQTDDSYDWSDGDDTDRDFDGDTYALEVGMFQERSWGSWLRGGPFLAVGYEYATWEEDSHRASSWSTGTFLSTDRHTELQRTWSALIGLRPVFRFHDRLLLETQLGLRLLYRRTRTDIWSKDEEFPEGEEPTVETSAQRGVDSSLSVEVFGEELGPGSRLTFVVLF